MIRPPAGKRIDIVAVVGVLVLEIITLVSAWGAATAFVFGDPANALAFIVVGVFAGTLRKSTMHHVWK